MIEKLTPQEVSTLRELLACYSSWQPDVRVLGNVRAEDAKNLLMKIMMNEPSIILLKKEYDGEGLYDASRDFGECFDADFNPEVKLIPQDKYGFQRGTFEVTVTWRE